MQKLKEILIKLNNWKFIILIVVIIGGSFYWFQIRPSKIYSKCNERAREKVKEAIAKNPYSKGSKEQYDISYQLCLRANGINK